MLPRSGLPRGRATRPAPSAGAVPIAIRSHTMCRRRAVAGGSESAEAVAQCVATSGAAKDAEAPSAADVVRYVMSVCAVGRDSVTHTQRPLFSV
ncbi:hypothetical protein NOGI109294_21645 [Nocardiopsis gilva]